MRVLFFTASVNIGGIERVFLSYATGLMAEGHDVHYVVCQEWGKMSLGLPDGLKLHCLDNVRLRYSVLKLRKLLQKIKPDIIITGNDSTLVPYLANLMIFGKKAKIITSQHSYYNNNETLFYSRFILKYIYPKCNKVIAVSSGIAEMLNQEFNMKEPFVKVINNPVDINIIDRDSKLSLNHSGIPPKYVTFVGRMTPVKNIKFLIDSFCLFAEKRRDISLILVGDGYERKELEEYADSKSLNGRILFVGVQSNPYSYIYNSELLLLPSLSEAYPTVLIEAMRLGVTCVCTPTLGAIDILSGGKYGYIANSFNDKFEYAQLMEHALDNKIDSTMLYDLVEQKYSLRAKVLDLINFINN